MTSVLGTSNLKNLEIIKGAGSVLTLRPTTVPSPFEETLLMDGPQDYFQNPREFNGMINIL
jgi:hypothetical protein